MMSVGDQQKALEALARAADVRPLHLATHQNYGGLLIHLDRIEEAVEVLERAAEAFPEDTDLHYNLGAAYKRLHRLDDAAEAYRRAAEISPEDLNSVFAYGNALVEQDRFEDAVPVLRSLVEKAPENFEAHHQLGFALAKTGDLAQGRAALERAVELAPNAINTRTLLTATLIDLDEWDEADRQGEICLEQAPGNRQALATKGVLLNEQGTKPSTGHLFDYNRFVKRVEVATPPGYDSIDDFNNALIEHIQNHVQTKYELPALSCYKGYVTDDLLVEPKGPMADFEKVVSEAGRDYMDALPPDPDHPWVRTKPDDWDLYVWATLIEKEGYQNTHIHPLAWLSGVYYAKLPTTVKTNVGNNSAEGWIEFGRPPAHYPCKAVPDLHVFKPEEGILFLFPSYYYHRTLPFEDNEQRVSIAFDFDISRFEQTG